MILFRYSSVSKKRNVCGKLIVRLARSGCNSAPRLNFFNIFIYCIKGTLTPISIHKVACYGTFYEHSNNG